MNQNRQIALYVIVLLTVFLLSVGSVSHGYAAGDPVLSKGQTLYVSVYSNIFSTQRQLPFNLASILSIRNTDMSRSIQVTAADYYDTKGNLIRKYYRAPITLAPLETTYIYIPEEDTAGGFGANFIVRWTASKEVNAPVVECLMVGMKGGQGISFVSPGQVIKEHAK